MPLSKPYIPAYSLRPINPIDFTNAKRKAVGRPIRLWDYIHIINFATNDMFPMLSALSLALVVMYYTLANFSELEAQRMCTNYYAVVICTHSS